MGGEVELRSSVSSYAFDSATFERLRGRVGSGALDPAANRLHEPPTPLQQPPVDLRASIAEAERARLHAIGEDALRRGKVAILVLNGGMATRFGGGAKGIVPVVPGHPRVSFLAIKLAEVRQQAEALGAAIPAVIMHSFATQGPSQNHLAEIG
jgi:UTP--glucose-1-phosphate uridylyltransferase